MIKKILNTQKSLGTRAAAGQMRNAGFSLEAALELLTGRVRMG